MKKNNIKGLVVLLTLTFSLLNLPLVSLFPIVKATYVEGIIDKDTVWTLLDSPFIVCQNVTIMENVTLTIEPGVEVKFGGGPFTIIVNGRLIAKGTMEKPIKFTSNEESPQAGDWAALLFKGAGQPVSILEHCVLEYGKNSIIVNGGTVAVKASVIQSNSESGIKVLAGSATVEQCNIQNNNNASIIIQGGNAVIQNNNITFNGNGVILAGNLSTSYVNITRNIISLNEQSGISLDMTDSGDGILIRENTISSNYHGIYVSTNASTFITRNYIFNNNIGAFYEGAGKKHIIRFNNIYGNSEYGLDASSDAFVNATQNYWGDKSGPYHKSLNPHGKGNHVGGNGVNIDFIFFLTAPIDHRNSLPTAVLWTAKNIVALGQEVTFVGTGSYDDGRVDKYFFNFGDGQNSSWTTLSIFSYKYASVGLYNVSLQVMDDFGETSKAVFSTVNVSDTLLPLEVSIDISNQTVDYNTPVTATVYVSFNGTPVESASVNLFAVSKGFFENFTDSTDSTGRCKITFTAPNVTDITYVRVMVKASKQGYADGSAYEYLMVLPPLNVDVAAEKARVYSEETVSIIISVTNAYGEPVANVSLRIWADNQTIWEDFTDDFGMAVFNFVAPVVYDPLNLTVHVEAVKESYAKSFGSCLVEVYPRKLTVHVTVSRELLVTNEEVKVDVQVKWEEAPVENAKVTLYLNISNFTPLTNITKADGSVTFSLNVIVPHDMTVNMTVKAHREGYVEGCYTLALAAKPANLTVSVSIYDATVKPGEQTIVYVFVKHGNKPVVNATVDVITSLGILTSVRTGDAGYCEVPIYVPSDTKPSDVYVTVKVAKYGYNSVEKPNCVFFQVVSEAAFPWFTLLLVLIPVTLLVVFVVLVKLGVIAVSFGEEEEEE